MKASQYNIIVERLGIQYWFNSLSRKGFKIGASLGNKLKEALNETSVEEVLPESFLSRLAYAGFIIGEDVNELEIVHGYY